MEILHTFRNKTLFYLPNKKLNQEWNVIGFSQQSKVKIKKKISKYKQVIG